MSLRDGALWYRNVRFVRYERAALFQQPQLAPQQ